MKSGWSALGVVVFLQISSALADYADQSKLPAPLPMGPARSVAHESFLESAKQSVKQAVQTARELGIALATARRNQDMMLATCLSDALATALKSQEEALATLAAMSGTANEAEARALGPQIMRTNQALISATQNASRCDSGAESDDGMAMELDQDVEATLDPGTDPGADIGVPDLSDLPTSLPPAMQPTIDVMEPGTDVPMTPSTASPMR
jgi:hypothetical protein